MDISDLSRFATVVPRLCTKKGYLHEVKRGNELEKGFYCLFGNLLYVFDSETDVNSVRGLVFLESSTCKVTNNVTPLLSISTVGGRTINFTASDITDLYEWLNAVEASKLVNMNRKVEDSETSLVSLQHKVENLEATAIDNEDAFMEMKKELTDTRDELAAAKKRMDDLAADKAKLVQHVKTMETERLLLLKSRGITPKRIPQWAVMDECADMAKQLRVWVGSWNLQGKDPFPAMDRERAKRLLKAFIPSGYDMYVLGIQECPNDSLVECADVLLEAEGYRRLTWTINNHNINNYYNSLNSPSDGGNMDPSKLYGKGKDSSLKSLTFLSTAIFVRNKMANDINILAIASEALSGGNDCQGAIAVAVNVFGRIVAVVNSEFDGKSNDTRRDQYQHLFMELGGKLAENSFHMNEQFHHVIWLGDMNHRLVDISGNLLPIDTAVKMLEDGRIMRSLFETHDELNRDKKQQIIFFNYREASPYPNFYPTYRKIRNHGPVDYSSAAWVRNTYLLSEKESFFKGGKLKEYVPGFSDRILYYSMVDLAEDFVPESLPADLEILGDTTMDCTSDQPVRTVINIDNYRSVNDGEGMTVSEHTPVYCTFLLRLRHDHDFTAQNKSNDINSLLSALTIPETPDRSTVPSSPAAPKTPGNGTIAVVAPATPQLTGRSVLGETPPRTPSNRPAPLISVPSRTSLLPLGVYRIRVSGMQLIWGMNQMHPVRASLLFPSPYEAVAGERFVDFMSEVGGMTPPASSAKGSFSSTAGGTPQRNSKKLQAVLNPNKVDAQWKNVGPSRTGTCICLESGRSVNEYQELGSNALPPVLLTWRGEEPLDRLHMSMKVTMMSQTIRSARAAPTGSGKNGSGSFDGDDDVLVGHCALSLEQLCKIAATSSGDGCSVTMTRMLVCRGRPMYCVDPQSMQREVVSFNCKLELIHK